MTKTRAHSAHQPSRAESVLHREGPAAALDEVARAIALLVVVVAVVITPIIAMLHGISTESFAAYIAPVTAITGVILGYWFGTKSGGPGMESMGQANGKGEPS
jgi:hypothetical protein